MLTHDALHDTDDDYAIIPNSQDNESEIASDNVDEGNVVTDDAGNINVTSTNHSVRYDTHSTHEASIKEGAIVEHKSLEEHGNLAYPLSPPAKIQDIRRCD